MEIRPLKLKGSHEIVMDPRGDARGSFTRTYDMAAFARAGLVTEWVQDNESVNTVAGILRGLHFQRPPFTETKLVRCVAGRVWDVFVDLRQSSQTYGQWDAVELSPQRANAVYIPKGFAHGYCTLTEHAVVLYKVDCAYMPAAEGGLLWNDADVNIAWPVAQPLMSDKDRAQPPLRAQTPLEIAA